MPVVTETKELIDIANKLITNYNEWKLEFLNIRIRKRLRSKDQCKVFLAKKFLEEQAKKQQ